jgi:hypothetical protein
VWGEVALEMNMDEAVREEILSTVVRAHVRLLEYGKADGLLSLFDRWGYRAGPFLRGFLLRRQEKYREAIPYLRDAMVTRRLSRSAVQELALCFQKLGMRTELAHLVREHEHLVAKSASLLDFKIGLLLSEKRDQEAEKEIVRLRSLPDDEGRSTMRQAQLLFQRDNNPEEAEVLLSNLIQHDVGDPVRARRWRAMTAAAAKHPELARRDIEFIRARQGRQGLADRLDIYFALAQHDYVAAEKAAEKLGHSASDELLRARLLEARAGDNQTPLADREVLRVRAAELRIGNRHFSEFDFD